MPVPDIVLTCKEGRDLPRLRALTKISVSSESAESAGMVGINTKLVLSRLPIITYQCTELGYTIFSQHYLSTSLNARYVRCMVHRIVRIGLSGHGYWRFDNLSSIRWSFLYLISLLLLNTKLGRNHRSSKLRNLVDEELLLVLRKWGVTLPNLVHWYLTWRYMTCSGDIGEPLRAYGGLAYIDNTLLSLFRLVQLFNQDTRSSLFIRIFAALLAIVSEIPESPYHATADTYSGWKVLMNWM